jgi:ATP-dependent helicase/nuclease subunit A
MAWLREARAEVKRDMEIARDEVRVMTVHGAKGLEAPIVILADTMSPPAGPRPPRLLQLAGGPLLWAGRKADDTPPLAAARQAAQAEAENEYRRLLYVAMTRAADRLIVCGADGRNKRPQGCWYDLLRGALGPLLVTADGVGEDKILRFGVAPPDASAVISDPAAAPTKPARRELPAWLRQPAPPETPLRVSLTPSSAFDEEIVRMAPGLSSTADRQKALQRGRLVHRLMQSLPDIAPERRKDAAEDYLAKAGREFPPAERTEIAQQVLAILNDLIFADLFVPNSRAEVPIVGRIPCEGGAPADIAGQVDRLAITGEAVLIADYKTDRAVPHRPEAVQPYVAQLALYRAVLSRLYPQKTVRAALLFTEGPTLMEIAPATMDAALAKVMAKASHAAVKVP